MTPLPRVRARTATAIRGRHVGQSLKGMTKRNRNPQGEAPRGAKRPPPGRSSDTARGIAGTRHDVRDRVARQRKSPRRPGPTAGSVGHGADAAAALLIDLADLLRRAGGTGRLRRLLDAIEAVDGPVQAGW